MRRDYEDGQRMMRARAAGVCDRFIDESRRASQLEGGHDVELAVLRRLRRDIENLGLIEAPGSP